MNLKAHISNGALLKKLIFRKRAKSPGIYLKWCADVTARNGRFHVLEKFGCGSCQATRSPPAFREGRCFTMSHVIASLAMVSFNHINLLSVYEYRKIRTSQRKRRYVREEM